MQPVVIKSLTLIPGFRRSFRSLLIIFRRCPHLPTSFVSTSKKNHISSVSSILLRNRMSFLNRLSASSNKPVADGRLITATSENFLLGNLHMPVHFRPRKIHKSEASPFLVCGPSIHLLDFNIGSSAIFSQQITFADIIRCSC